MPGRQGREEAMAKDSWCRFMMLLKGVPKSNFIDRITPVESAIVGVDRRNRYAADLPPDLWRIRRLGWLVEAARSCSMARLAINNRLP
jgi:hypothetical protein